MIVGGVYFGLHSLLQGTIALVLRNDTALWRICQLITRHETCHVLAVVRASLCRAIQLTQAPRGQSQDQSQRGRKDRLRRPAQSPAAEDLPPPVVPVPDGQPLCRRGATGAPSRVA